MQRGIVERGNTEKARPHVDEFGSMKRGTTRGSAERGSIVKRAAVQVDNVCGNVMRQRDGRHNRRGTMRVVTFIDTNSSKT